MLCSRCAFRYLNWTEADDSRPQSLEQFTMYEVTLSFIAFGPRTRFSLDLGAIRFASDRISPAIFELNSWDAFKQKK